jgi:hypothetical protein
VKTTKTPEQTYRDLRGHGQDIAGACADTMREHDLTAKQAAELCWDVETGKPMPSFALSDGSPNARAMAFACGADRDHEED